MLHYRALLPGEAVFWSGTTYQAEPEPPDDAAYFEQLVELMNGSQESRDDDMSFDEMAETYRGHLEELIRAGSTVGVFNDTVCLGLAAAQPLDRAGWWLLWECQVQRPYRGHGIGSVLLKKLEANLARLGGRRLLAHVDGDNPPVARFLQRNGFVPQGLDYEDRPTLILMTKPIAGSAS